MACQRLAMRSGKIARRLFSTVMAIGFPSPVGVVFRGDFGTGSSANKLKGQRRAAAAKLVVGQ